MWNAGSALKTCTGMIQMLCPGSNITAPHCSLPVKGFTNAPIHPFSLLCNTDPSIQLNKPYTLSERQCCSQLRIYICLPYEIPCSILSQVMCMHQKKNTLHKHSLGLFLEWVYVPPHLTNFLIIYISYALILQSLAQYLFTILKCLLLFMIFMYYFVPGFESRALHMLNTGSTTKLHTQLTFRLLHMQRITCNHCHFSH